MEKTFQGQKKILPDGSRTYVECKHYPGTQLESNYIFKCPSISRAIFKMYIACNRDASQAERNENIAMARNYITFIIVFAYENNHIWQQQQQRSLIFMCLYEFYFIFWVFKN